MSTPMSTHTMSKTEDLELGYEFDPTPSPIYASADNQDLNLVSVKVTVSNPTNGPVTLSKLEIQIPVGADVDGDLSPATNLPAPSSPGGNSNLASPTGSVVRCNHGQHATDHRRTTPSFPAPEYHGGHAGGRECR